MVNEKCESWQQRAKRFRNVDDVIESISSLETEIRDSYSSKKVYFTIARTLVSMAEIALAMQKVVHRRLLPTAARYFGTFRSSLNDGDMMPCLTFCEAAVVRNLINPSEEYRGRLLDFFFTCLGFWSIQSGGKKELALYVDRISSLFRLMGDSEL